MSWATSQPTQKFTEVFSVLICRTFLQNVPPLAGLKLFITSPINIDVGYICLPLILKARNGTSDSGCLLVNQDSA